MAADGTAAFAFEIPIGLAPGRHLLSVRDDLTGEMIAVTDIDVEIPSECLVDDLTVDIDGDFVEDSCDPTLLDGPLADADFDFVPNVDDNCPLVPNRDQAAIDGRSSGAACDEREAVDVWTFIVDPATYPLPPMTEDDVAMAAANETIVVDVLANDNDPEFDLDEGFIEIDTAPIAGEASVVVADGLAAISYTAPDQSATDTIVYVACDEMDRCAKATLTIDVVASSDCTISGTDGDDDLIGTEGADVICGFDGDDTISALGGDDIVLGGRGADVVFGGDGNDTIVGGRGHDELHGNAGDDLIRGRRGNDAIFGGLGDDELRGGMGSDTIEGRGGADTIVGGAGDDFLYGNQGPDLIRGRHGADLVVGGRGADVLYGGRGADELEGGNGDDLLRGRRGNDQLAGGPGDDVGRGGSGLDACDEIETATSCET